ncbi:OsmC family protein [Arenibacter latericius]|uniref:OsmC family protein n=1 Tax=Arenibacter latericius TaxID=86104 RepID=UPI0004075513|nr:OsmC family protein [Arenibacter latericius]
MDKHEYKVNLKWVEERKGILSSPELSAGKSATDNSIEVATPPEFPKGMPHIWSPEHLFTASVSGCLLTTFLAIAENSKLEFTSFECEAIGVMEKVEKRFLMTEIILKPKLIIMHEKDRDRAERVLLKSEEACLISNSINTKVSMEITVAVV